MRLGHVQVATWPRTGTRCAILAVNFLAANLKRETQFIGFFGGRANNPKQNWLSGRNSEVQALSSEQYGKQYS